MRIVHLNPFYFPYAGGIERRIRELARRHAERHDVTVVTSRLDGTAAHEERDGIHVVRVPSRFRFRRLYNPPFVSAPGLPQVLRELRPDLIDYHSRWSPSFASAFEGSHAARVFTYHNMFGEGSGLLGALSRWNDRRANRYVASSRRVLAVSQAIRADLVAHDVPADRITVSPNGVDSHDLVRLASQHPAPPDAERTIVSVGRVVHVKGFDVLIRSLRRLPPDVRLTICGDGPSRPSLLRLARRLGIADRVSLPGWVREEEKAALLRSCLAYVQPSRSEAFGMAALEAVALGAPVVASRVGGLPEAVGEAAVLVPPGDERALGEALEGLLRDPGQRRRLQEAGPGQAARYQWDRIASEVEVTYASVLHN